MRVKQLVVLNLCDAFDRPSAPAEDRLAARELFDKHNGRTDGHKPDAAWLIEVNNSEATGDAATLENGRDYRVVLPSPGPFAGVSADQRDIGVYIVFHARSSSDPNIFGAHTGGKAANKKVQATRLVGVLEKLRIRPIRKLVLLACTITNDKSAPSKNFLAAVGERLEDWGKDDRPIIAGYDTYIYVAPGGHKTLDAGGGKPATGTGHKQVWVYKSGILSGGYKSIALAESGWSDKKALPTNTIAAVVQ